MILASCRRTPDDAVAYPVPTVDVEVSVLRKRLFASRVLVLVHGYRSDMHSITDAYLTIQENTKGMYDEIIGFVWPNGWTRLGFYPSVLRARRSAQALSDFLQELNWCGCTVDVQTHSLGAVVALEAVRSEMPGAWTVRNLILAAPAVDHDVSLNHPRVSRLYIMHSRNDAVLKYGWPIAHAGFGQALGYRGPRKPEHLPENVRVLDCSNFVKEHGGYRTSTVVYVYWRNETERPRARQLVSL